MIGRLLVNAALLVCAAALGVWLYGNGRTPAGDRLSALAPAAVDRIVVDSGGERLALERADTGWRMTAPRALPASDHHVDMLLRFLQTPVTTRYRRDEVDLAAAGLVAPTLTVRFDDHMYAFGALEPFGQRRYLLDGDQVVLAVEGVSAILRSPWWNFIDRRLLPAGEPVALLWPSGRRAELDAEQQAFWRQAAAAIVRPLPSAAAGEPFALELRSGERLAWQLIDGAEPQLVRPDLALAYRLSPTQRDALLPQDAR